MPDYIKEVLQILSGLLVPIIAIITTYIAYQQYKTNRDKLRFGLYDKRYAVYSFLKGFISQIIRNGTITPKRIFEYRRKTKESEFLFDKEITAYLEEVFKKTFELHAIHERYSPLPVGDERSRLVDKEAELLSWFESQISVANDKFNKYLSFKDLK